MEIGRYAHPRGFLTVMMSIVGFLLVLVLSIVTVRLSEWKTIGDAAQEKNHADWLEMERFFQISRGTRKNNAGGGEDVFLCQSGVIQVEESYDSPPQCTGVFSPGSDGIDDTADNDDYRPGYSNSGTDLASLVAVGSRLTDNDAEARIHWMGNIPPGQNDVVFTLSDRNRQTVMKNQNNTDWYLPYMAKNASLQLELASDTTMQWTITILRLDMDGTTPTITRRTDRPIPANPWFAVSGSLSSNGQLLPTGIGVPMVIDASAETISVRIENSGTGIIAYSATLVQDGSPVYTVPVLDGVRDYPGQAPYDSYASDRFEFSHSGSGELRWSVWSSK